MPLAIFLTDHTWFLHQSANCFQFWRCISQQAFSDLVSVVYVDWHVVEQSTSFVTILSLMWEIWNAEHKLCYGTFIDIILKFAYFKCERCFIIFFCLIHNSTCL